MPNIPQQAERTSRRRELRPEAAPWPEVGFVGIAAMRVALNRCSAQTVYNYIADDLLPPMIDIGINRVGWPVDVARQALVDLPAKVAAKKATRQQRSVA